MEMDYRLFCLTFALVTSKSASQVLTVTPSCIKANDKVILRCETTDLSSSVNFYLEAVNEQGSCFFGSCTSIPGYLEPTQSEGKYTQMIIPAYNHSRDGGVWTCNFGGTSSNNYTFEIGNCESSNQSKKCGWHCLSGALGAFIGMVVGILIILLYYCKNDKKWTTFISWKNLHVSIEWILYVGLVCFVVCCLTTYFQDDLNVAIIAGVILMIITVVAALIADKHGEKDDPCFICLYIISIIGIIYIVYLHCEKKKGKKKIDDRRRADRRKEDESLKQAEAKKREEQNQKNAEAKKRQEEKQKNAEDMIKEEEKHATDLPEIVVVLATTIDNKGPISFVWINEKSEELTVDETLQSSQPRLTSLSSKKKAALTDSGIYQCERKFKNGVKDTINIVLHVSDICLTSLTVNPIFWAKQDFINLKPKELKKKVEQMDKGNSDEENSQILVKWQFRETPLEKYKKLSWGSSHIDLEPKKTGEYKCTVKKGHSIKPQVYFFCVQYLDGRGSQTEKCIVIGVPSMLNKKGIEDFD